jgi:hypothetical protein
MDTPRIQSLAAASERRSFCERLARFYKRHNPSKGRDVSSIVTIWAGKEAELFAELNAKYGSTGPAVVGKRANKDGSTEIVLEFAAQGSLGFMFKKNGGMFNVHCIPLQNAMQVGDLITHLNGRKVGTKVSQKQLGCQLRESPRPLRLTVKRLPIPLFGAPAAAPLTNVEDGEVAALDGASTTLADDGYFVDDGEGGARVRFLSEVSDQENGEGEAYEEGGDEGEGGEESIGEGVSYKETVEKNDREEMLKAKDAEEGAQEGIRWIVRCSEDYEVKEKGGKHVLHEVKVETGDEIIVLQRRTRQFRMLQRDLEKAHPAEAATCMLPDIGFIRDYGDANLLAICRGLDAYLQQLFALPVLAQCKELEMFLDDTAVAGMQKWRTGAGGGIGGKTTAIDSMLEGVPVEEVRIGRKQVLEVPIQFAAAADGSAAFQTLVWSFETLPNELLFSVIFDGVEHSKSKARSAVRAVQGTFALPKTREPTALLVCVLRFDNSYSPIRSKRLRYRATIISGGNAGAGADEKMEAKKCSETVEAKVQEEEQINQEVAQGEEAVAEKAELNRTPDQVKSAADEAPGEAGECGEGVPKLTAAERELQYKEQKLQRREEMLARQQQGLQAEVERLRMEQEVFANLVKEGGRDSDATWKKERYY